MSEYLLVENQGADGAALYKVSDGSLITAGHVDDVREHLIDLLVKVGVLGHLTNTETMPDGKFQWGDTYPTVDAFIDGVIERGRQAVDRLMEVRTIRETLAKTDGSTRSHLKVLTGMTDAEIDDLGGLADDDRKE